MISFPNAKINIGLHIKRKLSNGFHEIESLLYPIKLKDALEFVESDETTLVQSGQSLDNAPEDNIVMKAYNLLQEDYPRITALNIHLLKNIPSGAGLGGGSADASFMLKMLNSHFQLNITQEKLEAYAARIGSDCPFFIANKTSLATGRGDQLNVFELDLSEYVIQLICPELHVSTKQAYSHVVPNPNSAGLITVLARPIEEWKDHLSNEFEESVFRQFPQLTEIKNALYDGGAIYASMSGSGSSIYGIFPKNKKADIQVNIGFQEFLV